MKIPQQFHQFNDVSTLILVAGKQEAQLYNAHNGMLELVDSVNVPRPKYSDNEGNFKAWSQGGVYHSGGAHEIKDQVLVSDFIRELKSHLEKVRHEMYSEIVVLAPAKSKNAITKALPQEMKQKVSALIEGNYHNLHPLEVVEKIAAAQSEAPQPSKPMSEEAKTILSKTGRALKNSKKG